MQPLQIQSIKIFKIKLNSQGRSFYVRMVMSQAFGVIESTLGRMQVVGPASCCVNCKLRGVNFAMFVSHCLLPFTTGGNLGAPVCDLEDKIYLHQSCARK